MIAGGAPLSVQMISRRLFKDSMQFTIYFDFLVSADIVYPRIVVFKPMLFNEPIDNLSIVISSLPCSIWTPVPISMMIGKLFKCPMCLANDFDLFFNTYIVDKGVAVSIAMY